MALRSGRVGIHPSQVDPITGMLLNGPIPGSVSFEDLSDAQISNPEAGQTLQYNGTGWVNVFASISPTTLATLQDVQITDPEDGEYLSYDSTSEKWVNSGAAPGPVIPEGSTVIPTDDIQKWLNCAGIFDKTSYTTLADVLSDSTTLLALMSNNNAVDYLVRSTTWASGVTANSTAMTDIGANNYCANTLLDDSTWCTAICNSTYFESVLNVKVPTMTSNTAPSGECFGDGIATPTYAAYKAFDNNDSTAAGWNSISPITPETVSIGYKFTSSCKICKIYMKITGEYQRHYGVYCSNDGTTYTQNGDITKVSSPVEQEWIINPSASGTYWKLGMLSDSYQYTGSGGIATIQFYGRQDI